MSLAIWLVHTHMCKFWSTQILSANSFEIVAEIGFSWLPVFYIQPHKIYACCHVPSAHMQLIYGSIAFLAKK